MITASKLHNQVRKDYLPLSLEVLRNKYSNPENECFKRLSGNHDLLDDITTRVGNAIVDSLALRVGDFIPAGRILAGAGTSKIVTLMNCYVMNDMPDSMEGIADTLKNSMLTMQQGGGIGVNFSTLRPQGAWLGRTQAPASGPLPFMDMWDSMCRTIMSAGSRRGAMMATMLCTHPDIMKFILAKKDPARLRMFNVSVMCTNAFMAAVQEEASWDLFFPTAPADRRNDPPDFQDDAGVDQWIYSTIEAHTLWKAIIDNTYDHAEPGVIFIDRVNDWNNLKHRETIWATNPCGEQPLPPYGACNLGAVNLCRMVEDPFTSAAGINWGKLKQAVIAGVNFLDTVIDKTYYPLEAQSLEMMKVRRIGLGITGLADMLIQMRAPYGSFESVEITESVMRFIFLEAYRASVVIASKRGAFPEWNWEAFKETRAYQGLRANGPKELLEHIETHGLRNGVLLTVAPTGTTSVGYNYISSGLEPVFAHEHSRKVLQDDNTFKKDRVTSYIYRMYKLYTGEPDLAVKDLPSYFVTAQDLSIEDHVRIQAACQQWIDASVSKTINIPVDYPRDKFEQVYWLAWNSGCKGCTTYRPNAVTGSIMEVDDADDSQRTGFDSSKVETRQQVDPTREELRGRPESLSGTTYKIPWPGLSAALYLTVNSGDDGNPFEVFINSKDGRYNEWTTALTLMMTAIYRRGGDVSFVAQELQTVQSMSDTAWVEGTHYPSLVARIGAVLQAHIESGGKMPLETSQGIEVIASPRARPETCPDCGRSSVIRSEGCRKCQDCGWSQC